MANLSGLDTWSVISGAIGVLTVIPLICAYIWSQHPETKFAQLDSTLKETENLLRSVVEEGLLDPERHVAHFELQLKKCGFYLFQYCIASLRLPQVPR